MTRKCNTCGGIYEPIQGNRLYFHSCAPITDPITGERTLRKDHRNENITGKVIFEGDKRKDQRKVRSEGKGYTEL